MNTIKINDVVIGEGVPKICVPITGSTAKEIIDEAELIKTLEIDFVEWRADYFENIESPSKVLAVLGQLKAILGRIPILFTVRSKGEGGQKELSGQSYISLNTLVMKSGLIDLVDLELEQEESSITKLIMEANNQRVVTVISKHDFQSTPSKEEIISSLKQVQILGGNIFKIAVMPQTPKDVLTLLDATWEMKTKHADRPIITLAMGAEGVVSRFSGEIFGSAVTFGSVKKASAPGQLNAGDLKNILQVMHKHIHK